MGSGSGAGQNQQFPGYGGMNQQYSGPNWWAGQGGQQQGGGQPLWQNPFSPMTPADWDALKEQYYPKPVPPIPPEPGTVEHSYAQGKEAGLNPRWNTGSPEYANYMRAMATIYGTPTTWRDWSAGEGEGGRTLSHGYEYQGKVYGQDYNALNWAVNIAQNKGGVGPGQAESLYGPSPNPAIFGTIANQLQEWGVPASFLEVSHPAFQGYGGPGMGSHPGDFDASVGGFGFGPGGMGFGDNEGFGGGEGGAQGY